VVLMALSETQATNEAACMSAAEGMHATSMLLRKKVNNTKHSSIQ